MGIKRKLEFDVEVVSPVNARPMKQLRMKYVQTSSSSTSSDDIAMDDVSSATTAATDTDSPSYPVLDLYPFPSYENSGVDVDMDMDAVKQTYNVTTSDSRTSSNASQEARQDIGLLQPKSSFVHNVANCSQIPRLRVACEAGIGGQRTLWTQCEQCGAIEMIGS